MEKRIFLAIAISIAVLFGWAAIAPRLFPELMKKPEPVKTSTAPKTTAATSKAPALAPAAAAAIPEMGAATPAAPIAAQTQQTVVVETNHYRAVFSNRGAQLISFQLKNYKQKKSDARVDLVKARDAKRTDYPFTIVPRDNALRSLNSALWSVNDVQQNGQRVIQFRYSDGRTTATKSFRFTNQPFLFDFAVSIQPPSPYRIAVGPGIRTLSPDEQDSTVVMTGNGVVQTQGDFEMIPREKIPTVQALPGIDFIGVEDNYFMTALRPTRGNEGVLQRVAFFDAKTKSRRDDVYAGLNAASDGTVAGDAFFGPKETEILDRYNMGEALQLGWFDIIARFFLTALLWINQYTNNYGFAIIVLTILIKIVLYPLQHKQSVSMKKMQKVAPKIEAIKAKYKKARTDAEQRNKMNMETMQLYQKEGINPMAGCLPLLIQFPILIGFYNLLSRAIELRGAPWILWIRDLSEKDPTYILPILMTATMFLQTYIMPATGDPMQRRIFLAMPLVFGFLFKDFPSGLVLYWLVQNVLTIIQQLIMNKWWKDHPDDKDEKDKDAKK
ncbi:MAG TPA: membrane protein insertase YidC [Thermoanaerobaculia bacterium]|nr:membrane protein insertase YidC [Thermoanaerobaculia bacterium]